ncbi:MAG TPA: alpha/beta hydrolase [Opitutaceae bacterium]|nr:alpha/beta hydrolase [Opitutaceae bacterium]
MKTNAKTILLVHGLWVTPLSWDPFKRFYENLGYQVIAPAWPGIHGRVTDMRRSSESLNGIGALEVVEHYAKIIRELPAPPIIMGHSYGGLITQMLLDRGLGSAGVAIDSVPPRGIWILPLSTNLALVPAFLKLDTFRTTFLFNFKQWWRVFANTLPENVAREAYATQAIPASGRAIFQAALANVTPRAPTAVNFRNRKRAPLLVIGGSRDVIMPAALSRKIYRKHSISPIRTDYQEFSGRSHYIIAEPGWQEVADYALTWAEQHAHR